jgi:hypothetical protein
MRSASLEQDNAVHGVKVMRADQLGVIATHTWTKGTGNHRDLLRYLHWSHGHTINYMIIITTNIDIKSHATMSYVHEHNSNTVYFRREQGRYLLHLLV